MAGRIAFVVGEDAVFTRFCLPMARAGLELGYAISVTARPTPGRTAIPLDGVGVIPIRPGGGLNPVAAGYAAGQLAQALKEIEADLVVCVGMGAALVGGAACVLAGVARRIFVSPATVGRDGMTRLANRVARFALARAPLRSAHTRIVFGAAETREAFALPDADGRSLLVMDSVGVDPGRLRPTPFPAGGSLRIALVSSLTDPDEVELAATATRLARARGVAVELLLFRAPSPTRWGEIPDRRLEAVAAEDGIFWRGRVGDLPSVWRETHVALLPTADAPDGLLTLVEAAACGRPAIAADAPSYRRLIRDGREGLLVPPSDPQKLAEAIASLARDPVLLPRMGAAARARALDGFNERDAVGRWKDLLAGVLARPGAQ